ncbi:transposase [Streptomyces sp. NPDC002018]|uniref:helix-turn-helix domain-containing protein n=1 Tax=Streptomyces sp. NPDC002018 TaxID=3364629 RepID=UPI003673C1A6
MVLSDAERELLQSWVRRRSSAQSLVLRSRIVLESADGRAIAEVARRLATTTDTVRTWCRRFLERRLDGLCDEPRPGVPRKISDADVERVIPTPRSYAEIFLNVVAYVEHPAGGHFAAWEQPSAYTDDLRRAVKIAKELPSGSADS